MSADAPVYVTSGTYMDGYVTATKERDVGDAKRDIWLAWSWALISAGLLLHGVGRGDWFWIVLWALALAFWVVTVAIAYRRRARARISLDAWLSAWLDMGVTEP